MKKGQKQKNKKLVIQQAFCDKLTICELNYKDGSVSATPCWKGSVESTPVPKTFDTTTGC
jgi:hypothetical protein